MKQLKFYLLSLNILGFLCLLLMQYGCDKEEGNDGQAPIAAYTADQTLINTGSSVQFTDQSTNNPTSWSWDFGDGGTSTSQSPSHSYSSEGSFNVSLTATNSYGSDTETKTNYITVRETGTVNDYDGNTYNTIKIGTQVWMAENLKTTHYANGTEIQLVENTNDWDALEITDKAMCYYDNSSTHANTYGALYTWAAAMNGTNSSSSNPSNIQGVCPSGWHFPSDAEWKQLEMYLGMSQSDADDFGFHRGTDEASKLAGNSGLWKNGSLLENDTVFGTSGFTALPGGGRVINGTFLGLGTHASFWNATEADSSQAWGSDLFYGDSRVHRVYSGKTCGRSVRCIKDN